MKNNNEKKPISKNKIALLITNIVVLVMIVLWALLFLYGTGGNPKIYVIAIVCEVAFIIFSLIVYYLSVIADAVSRMAKSSEENKE